MNKQDEALMEQTIRYDFGRIPKHEAHNMWRCDILTGEMVKVHLKKETKLIQLPNRAGIMKKQLANFYYIDSKLNYFYMSAKTEEEAVRLFEANFSKLGEKLEAKKVADEIAKVAEEIKEDKK